MKILFQIIDIQSDYHLRKLQDKQFILTFYGKTEDSIEWRRL